MRVSYSLEVLAACPVDKKPDRYEVTVISSRTIPCEEILAAVASLKEPMFQEDLTVALARELKAEVRSVGWHSGIKTEVAA